MSISPIIAALDLARDCDRVIELSIAMAAGAGAPVVLLHAFDRPESPFPIPEAFAALSVRQRSEDAAHDGERERAMEALRARVAAAGAEVSVRFDEGRPWQAICDAVDALGAAMVVLGPSEEAGEVKPDATGWEEHVLGTNVDRVVRTACCPVLIAAGERPIPDRLKGSRWLVGTDFSPSSIVAIEVADAWAMRVGGALEVAHVVERGATTTDRAADAQFAEFVEANAAGASAHLVEGPANAAVALCAAAEDRDVDVLVVGTHGMSAHARLVVGSTGERCLRRARRTLLLVPTP